MHASLCLKTKALPRAPLSLYSLCVCMYELACEMVRYSALSGSSLAECAAMT